jgi:hypothetical protein
MYPELHIISRDSKLKKKKKTLGNTIRDNKYTHTLMPRTHLPFIHTINTQ